MVTVITPDRVVIGGGVAAAADLLLGPIRDELRAARPDDVARPGRDRDRRAGHVGGRDRRGDPRCGDGRTEARRRPPAVPGGER